MWSDLLTDFNGTPITYDEIGNPLTMGSRELSWRGRQLMHLSDGDNEISYAYNGDGQRVSKTVNGTTTEYFYNGELLAGQKTGDSILVFMYDNNGDIFGFIDGGTEYYYVKNAQNDVTAIASADGTIIANYYYDSWGQITEVTGNTEIAEINPIRYRSYYYDSETEWYFLNTRYYSPDLCRFINADSLLVNDTLLGFNIFSYCVNNPTNLSDNTGNIPFLAVTAIIGAVAGAVAGGIIAAKKGKNVWAGIGIGAVAGGLVGLGIGAAAAAILAGSATASTAAVAAGARVAISAATTAIGTAATTARGKINQAANRASNVVNKIFTKPTAPPPKPITNDITSLQRVGSALKSDAYHAFPDIVDNYAGLASKSPISNGTLYQLKGSLNGVEGRFEWIVQNNQVTHRMFVPGGEINGIPIMP